MPRLLDASVVPKWFRLLTNISLPAVLVAILSFGGTWSSTQAVAAFGLLGLCFGAFHQLRRPTTPRTRRIFAVLFVLVCVVAMFINDKSAAESLLIAIARVGGWTVGLGVAASFDPNDNAPVERLSVVRSSVAADRDLLLSGNSGSEGQRALQKV